MLSKYLFFFFTFFCVTFISKIQQILKILPLLLPGHRIITMKIIFFLQAQNFVKKKNLRKSKILSPFTPIWNILPNMTGNFLTGR